MKWQLGGVVVAAAVSAAGCATPTQTVFDAGFYTGQWRAVSADLDYRKATIAACGKFAHAANDLGDAPKSGAPLPLIAYALRADADDIDRATTELDKPPADLVDIVGPVSDALSRYVMASRDFANSLEMPAYDDPDYPRPTTASNWDGAAREYARAAWAAGVICDAYVHGKLVKR